MAQDEGPPVTQPTTVGLALIARDEESSLPGLLASAEGAFDQVVLVDTGSTDGTVDVFRDWAERQDLPGGYVTGTHEWADDFAAARNAADGMLETDWLCYADCDERIYGAQHLRSIVASVPRDLSRLVAIWRHGVPGLAPWGRARLWRRGTSRWTCPVDEFKYDTAAAAQPGLVDYRLAGWIHCRDANRRTSTARDVRIGATWLGRQPNNPYAHHAQAKNTARHGDFRASRHHFRSCQEILRPRLESALKSTAPLLDMDGLPPANVRRALLLLAQRVHLAHFEHSAAPPLLTVPADEAS
jgi:glycosyltransferase involved in cell wall biosynthesis